MLQQHLFQPIYLSTNNNNACLVISLEVSEFSLLKLICANSDSNDFPSLYSVNSCERLAPSPTKNRFSSFKPSILSLSKSPRKRSYLGFKSMTGLMSSCCFGGHRTQKRNSSQYVTQLCTPTPTITFNFNF